MVLMVLMVLLVLMGPMVLLVRRFCLCAGSASAACGKGCVFGSDTFHHL